MNRIEVQSKEHFSQLISNGFTIVDFYTEWCAPCKDMDKYLRESKLTIDMIRVNCDVFPDICNEFFIEYVPTIMLFVNKNPVGAMVGFDDNVKKTLRVLTRIQSMLREDPSLYAVVERVFNFADKYNLNVNISILVGVLHYKGNRCPCRPNINKCPCDDALDWIRKKGRCYCGLYGVSR